MVNETSDDVRPGCEAAARSLLRKRLLAERRTLSESTDAAGAEAAIAARLAAVLADLDPGCLGLYHPLRYEFNARSALAADARLLDVPLALPYARREPPRTVEFRRWDGMAPGIVDECGIASSTGGVVVPDVVVVPCVGFTEDGHRLGYGGGYYDKWLAEHPHVTAIGIAWSQAEIDIDVFAARPHDIALAFIVTERGVR